MLRISKAQVEAFKPIALADFETQMVAHSERFSPTLSSVLGKDQLRVVVRSAVEVASRYGFTFTGPVRLFIELGFLFGSGFHADPQYPWAHEFLADPDPQTQMPRAQELHARSVEAMDRINGPGDLYLDAAFERIRAFGEDIPMVRPVEVPTVALSAMCEVHPEKAAFVGEPALRALIEAGEVEAKERGIYEGRDIVLLLTLMFAFGRGCTDDPLYPWISRTLSNERIPDPARRVRQLHRKALTWVRAVLENKRRAS
ncbi:hypothetical protein [Chondromyces crocatus]|uniref:Uncharacterized protein n=1 Tax=Chondromyces crocatus TaxID=52 RepID=A0A0K1EC00_CHOCO|nr:hypothetical protein [Chondromyces crocatus]AKT38416.1 uncharacterized protein CMC5_025620 [Chondromyces crocatus]